MGNALGRQPADWIPNIVAQPQNENDINNPLSTQVRETFVHFMVPTAAIVIFANAAWRYQRERQRMEQAHQLTVDHLEAELTALRSTTNPQLAERAAYQRVRELLSNLDEEATVRYAKQVRQLDWYNDGLKSILDIRCSRVKRRQGREELERELLSNLSLDSTFKDVNVFAGVRDVIDHDHLFCGTNRENNGKFRQLYMQVYTQRLELARRKRVLEKLREELDKKVE